MSNRQRSEPPYIYCAKCAGIGGHYVRDPLADGHGGLNGGGKVYEPCETCHGQGMVPNPKAVWK